MKSMLLTAALGLTALALAAPASAQGGRYRHGGPGYGDSRAPYYEARRVAYENGYREGVRHGEKDGRRGENFAYRHDSAYQRADKGYHRQYGSIEQYRQTFRGGYIDGYTDAYYRSSPRRDDRGHSRGGRDDWGRRGPYDGGYGNTVPFQNGVNDGYEKGREDARARRSFDVLRHRWYRSGDRHYDSRFGSKQHYAGVYREGFKEGYERGYREGRWR
jgi:hypothetical protein